MLTKYPHCKKSILDVKDIDHSNLDNCKTNKSEEERKCIANDSYNKYYFKSNVTIEKIALNVYNNQVKKQRSKRASSSNTVRRVMPWLN